MWKFIVTRPGLPEETVFSEHEAKGMVERFNFHVPRNSQPSSYARYNTIPSGFPS